MIEPAAGRLFDIYYQYTSKDDLVASQSLPKTVLDRGLQLLAFMEERWQIVIGDDEFKTQLLHLEFIKDKESVAI
jgi:hypothetical protein